MKKTAIIKICVFVSFFALLHITWSQESSRRVLSLKETATQATINNIQTIIQEQGIQSGIVQLKKLPIDILEPVLKSLLVQMDYMRHRIISPSESFKIFKALIEIHKGESLSRLIRLMGNNLISPNDTTVSSDEKIAFLTTLINNMDEQQIIEKLPHILTSIKFFDKESVNKMSAYILSQYSSEKFKNSFLKSLRRTFEGQRMFGTRDPGGISHMSTYLLSHGATPDEITIKQALHLGDHRFILEAINNKFSIPTDEETLKSLMDKLWDEDRATTLRILLQNNLISLDQASHLFAPAVEEGKGKLPESGE